MLKSWIRIGLFCLVLLCLSFTGMAGSGLETAAAGTLTRSEAWPDKSWTVQFSQVLDVDSVTPETVYVLDSQSQKVTDVSLQVNENTISVGLAEGYSYPQGSYCLVVTPGVKSITGKELTEEVIKPFTVLGPTCFTFLNSTLPTGLAGKGYAIHLEGTQPMASNWAISQGSLPAGLTLDPASGELKGTPEVAGSYSLYIKRTNLTGVEEKALSMEILPSNFTLTPIESFSFNRGEQPAAGLAQLKYPGSVKKNIEVYWEPVDSQQAGSTVLRGQLGGSDYRVEVPGTVSYLNHVDFKHYYWSSVNWRTVTVDLDGKVRDAYMDASYLDRSRSRKMDYMKSLSDLRTCNVFGVNTNALNTGSSVSFRFYDAFGNLLEKRNMLVD